ISVIDGATREVATTITVSGGPHGIDFSSASGRVYNCGSAGIEVIATEGGGADTLVDTIETPGGRCNYLHFDESGRYGWATSSAADAVYVVDAEDDTIVATIATGDGPDKVAFFEGDRAVVTSVFDTQVTVIDTVAGGALGAIPVGRAVPDGADSGHRSISRSLDGRHAYVPNAEDGTITIIDVQARQVRGTVEVGGHPSGIGVVKDGEGLVYPR